MSPGQPSLVLVSRIVRVEQHMRQKVPISASTRNVNLIVAPVNTPSLRDEETQAISLGDITHGVQSIGGLLACFDLHAEIKPAML